MIPQNPENHTQYGLHARVSTSKKINKKSTSTRNTRQIKIGNFSIL